MPATVMQWEGPDPSLASQPQTLPIVFFRTQNQAGGTGAKIQTW